MRSLCPGHLGGTVLGILPLPAEYKAGLREQRVLDESRAFFLLGRYEPAERWWYWPLSVLVKLPPTLFVLLPLGLVAWRVHRGPTRGRALLVVAVPALALAAATVMAARPLGVRYLLPVVALSCVAISPVAELARRVRVLRFAVPALVAAQLVMLVDSVPHSLAWTVPFFGPSYRVAADSDVDWGQDLYRLREWAEGRDAWVAVLGPSSRIEIEGSRPLLDVSARHVTGWVAVSETTLTVYRHYSLAWLRAYCPVGVIGDSVLLYYFDEPPEHGAGPDAPARPCGRGSSRRP